MSFAYHGPHPVFSQPDPNTKLWRYLSLAKLVSLLDSSKLHFARADKMNDPFEGSWTKNQAPAVLVDNNGNPVSPQPPQAELEKMAHGHETPELRTAAWKHRRESAALSCWHLNAHESEAMWKLYATEGIAVQSTFARLVESLPKGAEGDGTHAIQVGLVRYVDYETEFMPVGNMYWPFIHKRLSFAHERELRAVIYAIGSNMVDYGKFSMIEPGVPAGGISVSVALGTLIEKVYVAPSSPPWFADAVRAVVHRLGHSVLVEQSLLDAAPFH